MDFFDFFFLGRVFGVDMTWPTTEHLACNIYLTDEGSLTRKTRRYTHDDNKRWLDAMPPKQSQSLGTHFITHQ